MKSYLALLIGLGLFVFKSRGFGRTADYVPCSSYLTM
jgi:hypothetical protein